MVLFAFTTFWMLAMICIGLLKQEDNWTKLTFLKSHKKVGNDSEATQAEAAHYPSASTNMIRLNTVKPDVNAKSITVLPMASSMSEPALMTEVQRIAQALEDYLYALIPVIYRYPLSSMHKHPHQEEEEDIFLQGIYQVFCAQHRVLRILAYASEHIVCLFKASSVSRTSGERTLFYSKADSFTKQRILFDIIYLVTAITMSCFVLAILYDLQYPVDDGYCATVPSAVACEYRKTLLDPWQSRCLWVSSHPYNDDATHNLAPYTVMIVESLQGAVIRSMRYNAVAVDSSSVHDDADMSSTDGYCRFNNNNNSLLAFVFSYLVTLTFAGVLALFLNNLMHTLSSHVHDHHYSKDLYIRVQKNNNLDGLSHNDGKRDIQGTSDGAFPFVMGLFPSDVLLEETFHLRHNISPTTILLRQSLIDLCTNFATNHDIDGHVLCTSQKSMSLVSSPPHSKLFIDQWVDKHQHLSPDVFGVIAAQLYLADIFFATPAEPQRGVRKEKDIARNQLAQAKRTLFLYSLFRFFPILHKHPTPVPAAHYHPPSSAQSLTNVRNSYVHRFPVVLRNWSPMGETPVWIACLWTLLIAMNAGALYFIFSKAAVRGYAWQRSFLLISLWEIGSEWLLLQSLEIWYFDVWLPWWIRAEVQLGIERICVSVVCKLVDQVFPGHTTPARSTDIYRTTVEKDPDRVSTMFVDALAAVTRMDNGDRDMFETFLFENVQTTLLCDQRDNLGNEIHHTMAPSTVTHDQGGSDTSGTGVMSMVTARISWYYTEWQAFRLRWLASCSLMCWETTFVMWFTLNMAWLIYLFYKYVKPFYHRELSLAGQVSVLLGVGVVAIGWVVRCYWQFHHTIEEHRRQKTANRYQLLYERISPFLWEHEIDCDLSKEDGDEELDEKSQFSLSGGETASFLWEEEDTGEESGWEMSSDVQQMEEIHGDDVYMSRGEEDEEV